MNIQTKKLDLIEWISRLNDNSIIDKLKQIKDDYSASKDWAERINQEELESINKRTSSFRSWKNTCKRKSSKALCKVFIVSFGQMRL